MYSYFFLLFITIIFELITYFFFIKKPITRMVFFVILINCFTHPIATIAYAKFNYLIIIEIGVFLTEIFLIKWLFEINYKKATIISFVANLLTAIIGMIIILPF